MRVVLDSNILIDQANGVEQARQLLLSLHAEVMISTMSWIEVMAGARTPMETDRLGKLLEMYPVIETTREIAQHAIAIRQQYRLRLPDAIIWATAKSLDACLLTRDTDYPQDALDIRIPYTL